MLQHFIKPMSHSGGRFPGWIVGLALFILPLSAHAQESIGSAQSLFGIGEILVRPVHFDDPAEAKSCRLIGEDLDETIMRELKDKGLPVYPEANSPPSTISVARIILVPQIVPHNSQGQDCVTWVALSAESRNHLRVLPVEIPRIVNVVYWRQGEVVASAISVHGEHVTSVLQNMIHHFGDKFKQAQPPKVGMPTTPAPR